MQNATGKNLLVELPDMIGDIVRNTRVGVDAGITITNSWNNGLAAHNLLTAMEHTFAFENGSAGAVTTAPPTKTTPQTIEALLQEVRTIEIANDDLNIAVDKNCRRNQRRLPQTAIRFSDFDQRHSSNGRRNYKKPAVGRLQG